MSDSTTGDIAPTERRTAFETVARREFYAELEANASEIYDASVDLGDALLAGEPISLDLIQKLREALFHASVELEENFAPLAGHSKAPLHVELYHGLHSEGRASEWRELEPRESRRARALLSRTAEELEEMEANR
ncbi:hypothetical protein [Haloferax sulfurifontis]|uniref:Uncharacterized protein n=1 Tax=Haloferax sulfurifontis ATCC BAA-897 TaxID=662480 RepID=M0I765_9EURY|nr:hypothetical protein [Haloferax sulfurifontis]ELZ92645.1 hypothetical protein C441_10513 [Haloferax sulfurifontis ATCC BAA-897]